jgi:hypothetical protein
MSDAPSNAPNTVNTREPLPGDHNSINYTYSEANRHLTDGEHYTFMLQTDSDPDDRGNPEVSLPILNMALARSNDLYHDSGSNRHVFYDRSSFTEYTPIPPLTVKGFGNQLSTLAVGRGTVQLRTINGARSFTLTNALHIPTARANLLSQVRLDRKGIGATLSHGKIVLFRDADGTPIVDGSVDNEMYRLHLHIVRPPASSPPTVNALSSPGFYTA